MKTDKYRFNIHELGRGECIKCGKRENCLLICIFSPFKVELRICYPCLLGYALRLEWQQAAKKRKVEKERKENDNQRKLLADSVAASEGGEPKTDEKDGQSGVSHIGDIATAKRKSRRGRPKKQKR